MSDDVLDAFDRFLLGHLPPVPEIPNTDDWFIRLLHIPEGLPETLWCIAKTSHSYDFKIVKFCESAWRAFWKAHARQASVPIVHRMESHQEITGPILELENWMLHERFGLCGNQTEMEWNCDQYRLLAKNRKCTRSLETINPRQNHDTPWIEIIEILEELSDKLPLDFREFGQP